MGFGVQAPCQRVFVVTRDELNCFKKNCIGVAGEVDGIKHVCNWASDETDEEHEIGLDLERRFCFYAGKCLADNMELSDNMELEDCSEKPRSCGDDDDEKEDGEEYSENWSPQQFVVACKLLAKRAIIKKEYHDNNTVESIYEIPEHELNEDNRCNNCDKYVPFESFFSVVWSGKYSNELLIKEPLLNDVHVAQIVHIASEHDGYFTNSSLTLLDTEPVNRTNWRLLVDPRKIIDPSSETLRSCAFDDVNFYLLVYAQSSKEL